MVMLSTDPSYVIGEQVSLSGGTWPRAAKRLRVGGAGGGEFDFFVLVVGLLRGGRVGPGRAGRVRGGRNVRLGICTR